FPSGHSSISFATAAFVQRRYGWAVGAPAYALSCYVAWGRVFAKKHHWWDVCAGAAIGAGSAYIFTKPFAKKHNLQISPTCGPCHMGAYLSFDF
ncbi:MAG: phosphatase PAP2 family protein, partial [Muribaculaceae bacterium]|nr:phosphatase PAP2 family protein [Muribaculaceae bacterium]